MSRLNEIRSDSRLIEIRLDAKGSEYEIRSHEFICSGGRLADSSRLEWVE